VKIEVKHTGRLDTAALEELAARELEIHQDCGFRQWELPIFAEHGRNYVFEADGEFIGTAQVIRDWDNPSYVYLAGFGILEKWQGQGLGTKSLIEVVKLLKGEGVRGIQLTVRPDNAAALKIYRDAGFITVAEHRGKYGCGEDRLVLRLDIKDGG
jgi:[ribosomal protein S18]-alanine N-acetyltransferase